MSEEPKSNTEWHTTPRDAGEASSTNSLKLSSRQQQILKFLISFRETHGYSPTIRDIQFGCSISSTSVVDYNLRILARNGVITRDPEISRSIEIVQTSGGGNEPITVPLIGFIAAGMPLPVPTDLMEAEEMVELPSGK